MSRRIILFIIIVFPLFLLGQSKVVIPIYYQEYDVEILAIKKLKDTVKYNNSSVENFKFVFYDRKGKCYFERYTNGELSEKGNYAGSLDTLRHYVSTRNLRGISSSLRVQKYFQPVKDGEWTIYDKGSIRKEKYVLGVLIN